MVTSPCMLRKLAPGIGRYQCGPESYNLVVRVNIVQFTAPATACAHLHQLSLLDLYTVSYRPP